MVWFVRNRRGATSDYVGLRPAKVACFLPSTTRKLVNLLSNSLAYALARRAKKSFAIASC